ncbi:MAG: YkgJ family cysteine cluster protein [Candidatus Omnitrophica bacterium]|jgi:Fe-S-cluster containining protein|nr:YkgJ family cysteine cluster protein [Candidatus Omnitrophota bacterium]
MNNIIQKLPDSYKYGINEVLGLFAAVDAKINEFVKITGIHCPRGCGFCCNSMKIETTVLEMLPISAWLWANGKADETLSLLSARQDNVCVFFKKDPKISQNGSCGIYQLRPLVCRLFGFFTTKDKNNKYIYGSCKVIKNTYPETYKQCLKLIESGYHPSSMTDFSIRVLAQGTGLGGKMFNINIAAKIALEKIGLALSLIETPPETPNPQAA